VINHKVKCFAKCDMSEGWWEGVDGEIEGRVAQVKIGEGCREVGEGLIEAGRGAPEDNAQVGDGWGEIVDCIVKVSAKDCEMEEGRGEVIH
jgi:hypothetical protein